MTAHTSQTPERLFSLDFFRGLTMFLLVAEATRLYSFMTSPALEGSLLYTIGTQFHHHPWNGLRFWDLIQPFFMFIVGVAMPYSLANRAKRGQTSTEIRNHAIRRSLLLLFLGWALYCIGIGKIGFHFQNVLAQLSVTYLLAYLVMRRSARAQISFTLVLLVISDMAYRLFPVEGFNRPFVPNENFGTWLDLQYGGADLTGHWVSFNAIPTTAHTVWGVLAGQLLRSSRTSMQKLKMLVIAGLIGVAAGYALDPVTPIIKRICTSSFVLVSGGWTILALAFSFWLIDIMKQKNWSLFFAIVGMNPLFIYLFANVGGADFIERIVHPFSMAFLGWTGDAVASLLTALVVLFLLWYVCYWLYKRNIFFRI